MSLTAQPNINIPQLTDRVIKYYYSFGNVQNITNVGRAGVAGLPSPADIKNLVPAMAREWYNFFAGKDYYGGEGEVMQVMATLNPCQQQKYWNDHLFKYIINRIDAWNRPLTDNYIDDHFYIYSSSKFGGPQNPESMRQINPVAGLGLRDNQIQIPYRLIQARNYERDITETLKDDTEYGTIVYNRICPKYAA